MEPPVSRHPQDQKKYLLKRDAAYGRLKYRVLCDGDNDFISAQRKNPLNCTGGIYWQRFDCI